MPAMIHKALSGSTDASGGYTVPDIVARQVLALVQDQAVTIDDCEHHRMTSDTLKLPKITSGSTVRWVAQNGTITGADIGFGETQLSAKKPAALMTASSELFEDSVAAQGVGKIITQQFSKDIALAIDSEILMGTGGNFSGYDYTGSYSNSYSAGTLGWTDFINNAGMVTADKFPIPDRCYVNPANLTKLALLTDGSARPVLDLFSYGSPMLKNGGVGTIYAAMLKQTTQLTTSEIIHASSKMSGYFGTRRDLAFAKPDYKTETDNFVFQATTRVAFAVRYQDSYSILDNIS